MVSIVVPVRNAERTIERTLQYLEAVDYPRDRLEIILADGGSTDGTVGVIKAWQSRHGFIRLVEIPDCSSPGHARNEALKVASGEYILFTDGDCAPEPDWVREILVPMLRDPRTGGVGGEILTLRTEPDNDTESYCEQVGFLSVSGRCGLKTSGYMPGLRHRAPHEVNGGNHSPFFATANAAFRKSVIQEVGGGFWHEPTGEDVDFSLRVLKRGYRLYFAKEAVVKHMHRVSLASFLKQWWGYGYGHPLLMAKHAAPELEVALQMGEKPIFLRLPSAHPAMVHVGAFHLLHVFLLTTVLTGVWTLISPSTGAPYLVVNGTLLALSAGSYFLPCARLRPFGKFLTWCKIRYLSNWAFLRGALAGSKRFGSFIIEPSW